MRGSAPAPQKFRGQTGGSSCPSLAVGRQKGLVDSYRTSLGIGHGLTLVPQVTIPAGSQIRYENEFCFSDLVVSPYPHAACCPWRKPAANSFLSAFHPSLTFMPCRQRSLPLKMDICLCSKFRTLDLPIAHCRTRLSNYFLRPIHTTIPTGPRIAPTRQNAAMRIYRSTCNREIGYTCCSHGSPVLRPK